MAVSIKHSLMPILDTNGVPINGAKVYVYAAGTTTPLSLYSDSGLSTGADNPILCPNGFVPLRFIASASYKVVVTTSSGASVTGYDGDNIDPGVSTGSGALPVANGGTGATTAPNARTNLAAAAATDMATAQSDIADLQAWDGYSLTTRTRIASGTTAQEPASANPSFRYDTTTGRLRFDNASAFRNVLTAGDVTAADMMTGSVVQVAHATPYTTNADILTVIPYDDTIPQITEGTEILTVTVTPKHASSTMVIQANLSEMSGTAAATVLLAAVFKNTQTGAIRASAIQNLTTTNLMGFPPLYVTDAPGSTSPITYSVRVGQNASGAIRLNGTTATGRILGGASAATLSVVEVRG